MVETKHFGWTQHIKKNVGRPKEIEVNYEDKTGNLNTKILFSEKEKFDMTSEKDESKKDESEKDGSKLDESEKDKNKKDEFNNEDNGNENGKVDLDQEIYSILDPEDSTTILKPGSNFLNIGNSEKYCHHEQIPHRIFKRRWKNGLPSVIKMAKIPKQVKQ